MSGNPWADMWACKAAPGAFRSRRQDPGRGGPDRFRTGGRGTHAHTPPPGTPPPQGSNVGRIWFSGKGMFVPRCPGCRFCGGGGGGNSWAKCDCRIFRPIGKTRGRSRPGVCAVRGLAGTGAALPMPEGGGVNTGLFIPKRELSDAAVGSEPEDVPVRRILGGEFPGILCLPACTFSGSEHRYGQTSCPIQTRA